MSHTYQVLEVNHLTESVFRLRTERPQVSIRAGQCFNVGLPGSGVNREYSMYSAADAPYLDFLIKVVKGGCVSPGLQKLRIGERIDIDGPYGEFCLPAQPEEGGGKKYLFLASGTGIAPFHSFAQTWPQLDYTIIHGIRHQDEQYDAAAYPMDRYIPCISNNPAGHSLRVTDYLRGHPINPNTFVYLCGNRNLIIDAFEILRQQGVPGDNLFTEVFF